MRPLSLDDVLARDRYGAARDAIRARVIAHKRARRVAVGDRLSFVFEDRATVWYQTQEMLWVEHITTADAIRDELDVYGALLPGPSELSATMLIEIVSQARIRDELDVLRGIDRHVALEVEGHGRTRAVFEAGRESEAKLSAVQYVRFPLDDVARARVIDGAALTLVVDHPHYRHSAGLPEAVRASLALDLADAGAGERALRVVRGEG